MIRLRVVGIFYDESFDAAGINNIKNLLDAAVLKSKGAFSYTASIKHKTIGGVEVACNSLFGFTHELKQDIKPSLGNKERKEGYYKLFESTSVERNSVTVHAWQYYVIRGENVQSNYWNGAASQPDVSPAAPLPYMNAAPGFTPFDVMDLKDGDEVVWRNVSIVRNPQTPPIY